MDKKFTKEISPEEFSSLAPRNQAGTASEKLREIINDFVTEDKAAVEIVWKELGSGTTKNAANTIRKATGLLSKIIGELAKKAEESNKTWPPLKASRRGDRLFLIDVSKIED